MAGASGILVWGCACMSVCNRFTVEVYGVYAQFACLSGIISAIDDIDIAMEDDDRLENKSRDRRQLAAQ